MYEIYQRDYLGAGIHIREVAKQKLDYIYFNPLKWKWKFAKDDINYHFSSAKFYESGFDNFYFLKNIFISFDVDLSEGLVAT